jgi:hypothetical protein
LKTLFAKSPVFKDMFSMPQLPNVKPDGTDETCPLKLEGITVEAFKAFVRVAAASE